MCGRYNLKKYILKKKYGCVDDVIVFCFVFIYKVGMGVWAI